jgi:hypothetical protein
VTLADLLDGIPDDAVHTLSESVRRTALADSSAELGVALRRLGLLGYLRESTVRELANGAIGTLADNGHSVVVIDGALDYYGSRYDLRSSAHWMNRGFRALKLV